MRQFIIVIVFALATIEAFAKPHCQGFNNYDDKITIVFTIDPESWDGVEGETFQITAEVLPENTTDKTLEWIRH